MAALEELVLSGKLFSGERSGSSSPVRAPSPDAGWHDEHLKDALVSSDDEADLTDAEIEFTNNVTSKPSRDSRNASASRHKPKQDSIGIKPGRTGVKGVIRDRNEANAISRIQRAQKVVELNKAMEKASLTGKTFMEEEREKLAREAALSGGASSSDKPLSGLKKGKFGHLREVGRRGFVNALDGEDPSTFIVVHIYEPSVERCFALDEKLALLARTYSSTKFIRVRAAAVEFTSARAVESAVDSFKIQRKSKEDQRDYDDSDEDELDEEEAEEIDAIREAAVDVEMLPTMLVYRGNDLIHNWVRVDWEAGKASIEELLQNHGIIEQGSRSGHSGLSDFSDDDLFSDQDELD